ncbi:hypothetical protein AB5J62_33705 [Amycolatopsis sp. cg5]|uniref:hypothetical protein n=1 Tax=Amycolatopsis sp. cg5 TaxID=3238802 RepID=UPI0035262316
MRIILRPRTDPHFGPSELADQLGRWLRPDTTGSVKARVTISGRIKEITLDLDHQPDESDMP